MNEAADTAELTRSVDGKNYKNPEFIKKRAARQNCIRLALENPDWNIPELLTAQHKAFPNYTETALRLALRSEGIIRKKPRPVGVKYGQQENSTKSKVVIRASVHSYHGRSRLSASYTEL